MAGSKMELFDYIEVVYNQRRRHSRLGQISPAALQTACSGGVTEPFTGSDQAQRAEENMTTPTESANTKRARIQMGSAAPTFLVADVGYTAHWYAAHLGFQMAGAFPDGVPYAYASLRRDGVEIMLLNLAGFQKPDLTVHRPEGLWDAYIRMRGVQSFYEGLRDQGFIKMPLRKQPYGDWEFEVRDPNGYILVFSELVE
jgi:uncharacterized glyoxalase superfamily protein PhnB